MACHNRRGAKDILGALREVDSSIGESDSKFWHKTLGSQGGGTAKADSLSAMSAIDAAWLAATKNNADWSKLTPQERLEIQDRFRTLREQVEDGKLSLTQNQVMKLGAYTAKKKRVPMITRIGMSVAGLVVASGLVAAPAAAAPNTTKSGIEYVWATKKNADEIHMKARGKSCPDDFTLARAKGTHKVTWQYPKRLGEKTLKKGKFACIYTSADGVTAQGTFDKNGVLTALPSNFPKNPTAEDIRALGLTPDMKVAPNLRLPKPSAGSEITAPVLPEKVTPVATHQDFIIEREIPAEGYWEYDYSTTSGDKKWVQTREASVKRSFPVEVEYHGGAGVLMVRDAYDPDTGQVVKYKPYTLAPDKVTTVYQMFDVAEPTPAPGRQPVVKDGGTNKEYFHVGGFIAPDYGQANVPASMLSDWGGYEDEGGIWERRARKDNQSKQSGMVNLGKWANAGRVVAGEPKDGYAYISNLGNILNGEGNAVPDYTNSVKGARPLPWN